MSGHPRRRPRRHALAAVGAASPLAWKLAAGAALAGLALLVLAGILTATLGREAAAIAGGGGECAATLRTGPDGPPAPFLPIYRGASERHHLSARGPSILAAIHGIENGFSPGGGPTSSAGATGPMQFLPSTWAVYGEDGDGDGMKDINDVDDAIFAAANYLHASGAPTDWRRAIFSYNHADWYVNLVLRRAASFEGEVSCELTTPITAGPAELRRAIVLHQPRTFTALPARVVAPGHARTACDTRLIPNVLRIIATYRLVAWDCRASAHNTHGAGFSIDLVPAEDPHPSPGDRSTATAWARVRQLAYDLGWRETCSSTGCFGQMAPAIQAAFYNGYPNHGDPAHYTGSCSCPHLHLSWVAAGGISARALGPPRRWVKAFPSPGSQPTSLP